jgi:hypothetical protein
MKPKGSLPYSQHPATNPFPEPDESSPHLPTPIPFRSVLILSLHLSPGLSNDLFHSRLPTKILYTFLTSPKCATWSAHLIFLDLIIPIFHEEYRLWSSSLCDFLESPVTSSHWGPNILGTPASGPIKQSTVTRSFQKCNKKIMITAWIILTIANNKNKSPEVDSIARLSTHETTALTRDLLCNLHYGTWIWQSVGTMSSALNSLLLFITVKCATGEVGSGGTTPQVSGPLRVPASVTKWRLIECRRFL